MGEGGESEVSRKQKFIIAHIVMASLMLCSWWAIYHFAYDHGLLVPLVALAAFVLCFIAIGEVRKVLERMDERQDD
jgi:hypothetical protein